MKKRTLNIRLPILLGTIIASILSLTLWSGYLTYTSVQSALKVNNDTESLGITSSENLKSLGKQIDEIFENNIPILLDIESVLVEIVKLSKHVEAYLLHQDLYDIKNAREVLNKIENYNHKILMKYNNTDITDKTKINEFSQSLKLFFIIIEELEVTRSPVQLEEMVEDTNSVISSLNSISEELFQQISKSYTNKRNELRKQNKTTQELNKTVLENSSILTNTLKKLSKDNVRNQIFIITVLALLLTILSFQLRSRIGELSEQIGGITRGSIKHIEKKHTKDALGDLQNSLDKMTINLEERVRISSRISDGYVDDHVTLLSEEDSLGHALNKMIDSLKAKVEISEKISEGDLHARVKLSSEGDRLGIALNHMSEKLKEEADKRLAAMNESEESRKKAENILQSIGQGLVVVDENLCLSGEYSSSSENILNKQLNKGMKISQVLFDKIPNEEAKIAKDTFVNAISTCFALIVPDQFPSVTKNLPPSIDYYTSSKDDNKELKKILGFKLAPVFDHNNDIHQVIITFDDITKLEELKDGIAYGYKKVIENLEHAHQIVTNEEVKGAIIPAVNEMNSLMEKITSSSNEISEDEYKKIFRNIHTIKGGARTFNLEYIQHFSHTAEEIISAMLKNPKESNVLISKFKENLETLSRGVKSLHWFWSSIGNHKIENNKVLSKNEKIRSEWSAFVNHLFKSTQNLANELNKPIKIDLKSKWAFDNNDMSILNQSLIHMMRNSLDHGIENTKKRIETNKNEVAKILVNIRVKKNKNKTSNITVEIEDDGGGINVDKLKESAIKKGIKVPDNLSTNYPELVNILCNSGVSSKDKVTDISGRGVGMDAVRSVLQENGGDITLVETSDQGCKFKLTWNSKNDIFKI